MMSFNLHFHKFAIMQKKYCYLIYVQYLGFRFHGWAKQPNGKTIQATIDRVLDYVLNKQKCKTLVTSRTDAMVSANHTAFEIFLEEELSDSFDRFLQKFNQFLPNDIRALSIERVDNKVFNIINASKLKKYMYLFSFGEKAHPFSASLISSFPNEKWDIELLKEGTKLFLGTHDFYQYCTKPAPETNTVREISHCQIVENTRYTASFFPEQTYSFEIHSKGFMQHQIRLMMGQLVELGRGHTTLDKIKESLVNPKKERMQYIAPANGLILDEIEFD